MIRVTEMVTLEVEGDVAVVTVDNPPVNALAPQVRDGVHDGVALAIADPQVRAIVLTCAGRTFIAGGDIASMGSKQSGRPVREVGRLIASSPKPVIAAIHGSALGGGLEISLAAHWRAAAPSARVGLPEVKLGILPGAGGTQRLPRLVGAAKALEMIIFGEAIGAREALEAGLIDELLDEGRVRESAVAFARRVVAEKRPLKLASEAVETLAEGRANMALFDDFKAAHPETFRGARAPNECLHCIRAAFELPFEEGLDLERRLTDELIPSDQSKAMRRIFFAERDLFKIPGVPRDAALQPIRKVAVLAATADGIADARVFAGGGLPVVLFDRDAARLAAAEAPGGVAKSGEMAALADCDLVLDPTFGPAEAQRALIAAVAPALKADAIVSTTALENVGDLVAPERLIGVHFFYPGDQRRFVEVVRSDATSGRTAASVTQLLKRLGKLAMLVKPDALGVASRMMRARQASAEAAVLEGAATPAAADRALYDFGFAEGVFAWEDRIGLDVGWIRTGAAGDELRAVLCAAGRTGRNGRGFYDRDADGTARPSAEVEALAAKLAAAGGHAAAPLEGEALTRRLLLPIVNEAARLIEEGLVIRASDVDLMCVAAYGWPAYQGGPTFYGETLVGLPQVVEGLKALEARFGEAYRPAALLERLAAAGRGFDAA
jgi:3-hydroxyacyl-CoA dehydrogenase